MLKQMNKLGWLVLCLVLTACGTDSIDVSPKKPTVPMGYVARLEIQVDDRILAFGPFVGYYFRPSSGGDLSQLDFICYNERSFYTRDLPANALLYAGHARWRRLPDTGAAVPSDGRRIVPVSFSRAPGAWLDSRPEPADEYVHFHSAYDDRGATSYGYWLRHTAKARFTYDMGGRVARDSPLYHRVEVGPDRQFARIIEFDHGPAH